MVEVLKKTNDIKEEIVEKIDGIRESIFKIVFSETESFYLAGYVSDDFGLINDALVVGYTARRGFFRLSDARLMVKFPVVSLNSE